MKYDQEILQATLTGIGRIFGPNGHPRNEDLVLPALMYYGWRILDWNPEQSDGPGGGFAAKDSVLLIYGRREPSTKYRMGLDRNILPPHSKTPPLADTAGNDWHVEVDGRVIAYGGGARGLADGYPMDDVRVARSLGCWLDTNRIPNIMWTVLPQALTMVEGIEQRISISRRIADARQMLADLDEFLNGRK